jgi:hypothetical protein
MDRHVDGRWVIGLMAVLWCAVGCGEERFGHASVSAAVVDDSRCPEIYALSAQPGRAWLGGQIDLKAIATASHANDVLEYAWSPVLGLVEASSPNAVYTCVATGDPLMTVKVTEIAGAGSCSAEESLPVHCLGSPPP